MVMIFDLNKVIHSTYIHVYKCSLNVDYYCVTFDPINISDAIYDIPSNLNAEHCE